MTLLDYAQVEIPTVKKDTPIKEILKWMEEWKISELAFVDEYLNYSALIKEEDLLAMDDQAQINSGMEYLYYRPSVSENTHPYEAACLLVDLDISVVPIVDETNKYLGMISKSEMLNFICDQSGLNHLGGVIVLSMSITDYVLSQISRICENNNIIVLNSQIFSIPGTDIIDVVLKTNTKDLMTLKSAFERYDYVIKSLHGEQNVNEESDKRYRLLMNYINM